MCIFYFFIVLLLSSLSYCFTSNKPGVISGMLVLYTSFLLSCSNGLCFTCVDHMWNSDAFLHLFWYVYLKNRDNAYHVLDEMWGARALSGKRLVIKFWRTITFCQRIIVMFKDLTLCTCGFCVDISLSLSLSLYRDYTFRHESQLSTSPRSGRKYRAPWIRGAPSCSWRCRRFGWVGPFAQRLW